MSLSSDATLEEKITELQKILREPHLIPSLSQGSRIVLLTVEPKKEKVAMDRIEQLYEGRFSKVNVAKVLVEAADDYGLAQLREDMEFFGESFVEEFSQKLQQRIITEILRASEEAEFVVVHRLGILNGLLRLNPIIEPLVTRLKKPVIVIYPGTRRDEELCFLDSRHTASVYRTAKI